MSTLYMHALHVGQLWEPSQKRGAQGSGFQSCPDITLLCDFGKFHLSFLGFDFLIIAVKGGAQIICQSSNPLTTSAVDVNRYVGTQSLFLGDHLLLIKLLCV